MEAARRDLDRMRANPEAWAELRYEAGLDAEGYEYDVNAVRRAKVLWAMQYDRRPDDLALIRWLVAQEAVCRRKAPFQGLSEEAELAGFLLAEHRQVEDVWLQWELKRANFDTYCGYDMQHVLAAGIEVTRAAVRAGDHPERADVLERLDEVSVTEDDLAAWASHQRERFTADPADEDPLTWIDRAVMAGEREQARRRLDEWAAGRPRDEDTLSTLKFELHRLGAFAEAAAAQREMLAFVDGAWDTASALESLAALERLAGDHQASWTALRECRRHLDDVDRWPTVGLGRGYVEELFLLAGTADRALAADVFAAADRGAAEVGDLPLVVLRAAAEAARNIGDDDATRRYSDLAEAERQRIGL
jgi:hypothetical protein